MSFNLYVLYGICNSLQEKYTSRRALLYGNIVMNTKIIILYAVQLMKLTKTSTLAVTHIPT